MRHLDQIPDTISFQDHVKHPQGWNRDADRDREPQAPARARADGRESMAIGFEFPSGWDLARGHGTCPSAAGNDETAPPKE